MGLLRVLSDWSEEDDDKLYQLLVLSREEIA